MGALTRIDPSGASGTSTIEGAPPSSSITQVVLPLLLVPCVSRKALLVILVIWASLRILRLLPTSYKTNKTLWLVLKHVQHVDQLKHVEHIN